MIERCVMTLLVCSCLASAQKPDQLLGRWKVTAVATACPVTAMSGSAAARLVGQPLTLTRHTVHFARQTCRPIYELSKETLAEVSQEYKIDAKALKLPDPVIRVDADCTEVFIREPGKILFTWNGYFLEATRSSAAGD